MRLGLYGGSFDPIHLGHIRPVLTAVEQLELDRVLYLPTGRPPHKQDVELAPAARRFAMVEIALMGLERLEVSDVELSAETRYTIDTVEHFERVAPEADLHLLIGSDSLAQIEGWRRWQDLLDRVTFVVLRRPGWDRGAVLGALSSEVLARVEGGAVHWVDNRPLEISATEIRRRLRVGEPVSGHWVPEAVVEYAKKYCLYS